MADLVNYGDQWRYVHEEVAKMYGSSPALSDAELRAVISSTMMMFGTLTKALLDKGTLTDTDMQGAWALALAADYETVPIEPTSNTGTRANKNPNPSCANDATGWSVTSGSGARTAVSGFGRPNVYRFTGSPTAHTPHCTVAPGEVWTFSAWMQAGVGATGNFEAAVVFYSDAAATTDVATSVGVVHTVSTAATPTRVSTTVTVPPGSAVSARMRLLVPSTPGTYDMTMVLAEHTSELRDYFDGDTPGATWDGTAGSSASTWVVS